MREGARVHDIHHELKSYKLKLLRKLLVQHSVQKKLFLFFYSKLAIENFCALA